MIYLIGGAPRVGKSIIAERISASKRIGHIDTDVLCEAAIKAAPVERRAELFPFPGFSGDPAENVLPPEARVRLQYVSADSMKDEIGAIVARSAADGGSIVIEGIHLLPSHVHAMIERHGLEKMRAVFIGYTDRKIVLDGMALNSSANDWLRGANDEVRGQVADFVTAFSDFVGREAKKYGLGYIERTGDFESDIQRVIRYLNDRSDAI